MQLRDDRPGVGSRDCWGLFGGFIEQSEKPADAAIREVNEELSIILDPARLSLLGEVETRSGLHVFVFRYPVADELGHAVLTEGQAFAMIPSGVIQTGTAGGKKIVPDHVAICRVFAEFG